MATARKIDISIDVRGNYHIGHDAEAAKKTSELLQYNMENYHMIYLDLRHNHIVHHTLTAYALGATAEEIQGTFDRNAWYQKNKFPVVESDVQAMSDKNKFRKFLDKHEHYSSFLEFFQREIESKGVEAVLVEHLLANDDHANLMLYRAYASLMHPILHLGYAFEFKQPALVAEALAQAAIHQVSFGHFDEFMLRAEKEAEGIGKPDRKTLRQIMDELRADERVRTAHLGEVAVEKFRVALPKEMDRFVRYISQLTLSADQVEPILLETYDLNTVLVTSLPDPPESYQVNFIYLHSINMFPMIPSIMKTPWLSHHNKLRLMEWLIRYNLLIYGAHGAPELTTKDLERHETRQGTWKDVIKYSVNHKTDDGHLSKMIRALAFGREQLKPLQKTNKTLMKDHLWLKLAIMACDSVSETATDSEERWLYL